jgi:hypothetical protein
MKNLKRIEYPTGNTWSATAPAYNLKIYNVIKRELQNRAYEIYADEDLSRELYDEIEALIDDFTASTKYAYTAGFNGRQGGHLVLYKSCRLVSYDSDGKQHARLETYTHGLDEKDIDGDTLRKFRKLALDIIKTAEAYCKKPIETETYTIEKQRKYFGE